MNIISSLHLMFSGAELYRFTFTDVKDRYLFFLISFCLAITSV